MSSMKKRGLRSSVGEWERERGGGRRGRVLERGEFERGRPRGREPS